MKKTNANRIRALRIWDILNSETDEEHRMDTEELRRRLAAEGIECERRVIYNDIKALCDGGYEVMTKRGVGNEYYVAERRFSLPELRILMDAVRAAGFVTKKKTGELVDKIAGLAGGKRGDSLRRNVVRFDTVKSENENIYYSVNEITQAIIAGKKISFNYFYLDEKLRRVYRTDADDPEKRRIYVVSPEQTVFADDKYYLFCHDDKHGDVVQYRVDRMSNVSMIDEDKTPAKEAADFDLSKHKLQLFGMFGGKEAAVKIKADRSLLDVVIDKFGGGADITAPGGKITLRADVQVSPMFIAWCCSFGNQMEVVAPAWVRDMVKEHLEKTLAQYV